MLRMRREQMEVLAQVPQREYLKQMVEHAKQFFPGECKKIGAQNLEKFIQDGIAKANSYGIEGRSDMAQFLDLKFAFGAQFDQSCVWAREILENPSLTSGTAKVTLLTDAGMEELQRSKPR